MADDPQKELSKRAAIQAQINKLLKEGKSDGEAIKALRADLKQLAEEELALQKKINAEVIEYYENLSATDKIGKALLGSLDMQLEYQAALAERSKESLRNEEATLKRLDKEMERRIDAGKKINEEDRKALDNAKKRVRYLQQEVAFAEEDVKIAGKRTQSGMDLLATVRQSVNLGGEIYEGKFMRGFDGMGDAIRGLQTMEKPLFTFGDLVARGVHELEKLANRGWELTLAMDEARSSIQTTYGATDQMVASMNAAYKENRAFGLSVEDSSKAFGALHSNFTEFKRASDDTQKALIANVGVLEDFGIGMGTTAANIQIANKALGMTGEEAVAQQRRLAAFALDIGMAPEQMAEGFKSAGDIIAKMGAGSEQAMKDLAKTSEATGMAMSRIVDIAKTFDQFDTAADGVGRLNALLGGDFINVMEMMEAESPAERFKMLTDAVGDAGVAFDDMTYYEKLAMTEAMGLSDVSELAAAMSGDMDSLGMSTEKTSADFEEMRKRAKRNQDMMSQLNDIVDALTPTFEILTKAMIDHVIPALTKLVDSPVIQFLTKFIFYMAIAAAAISPLLTAYGAWISMKKAWAVMTGIETMAKAADTAAQGGNNIQKGIGVGLEEAEGKIKKQNLAIDQLDTLNTGKDTIVQQGNNAAHGTGIGIKKASGKAAGGAAKGLMQFALATLAIGAGIGLAAAGLGLMALGFSQMNVEQMIGMGVALVAIAAGVALLGAFGTAAAPGLGAVAFGLLGIGASLLMVGAGVAMVMGGITMVVTAFTKLFEAMNPENMKGIASAMKDVAVAISDMNMLKLAALATIAASTAIAAPFISAGMVAGAAIGGAVGGAAGGGGGASGAGGGNFDVNVKVYLDGKALNAKIDTQIEKKIAGGL